MFQDTPRDGADLFSNLTAHFAVFGQNSWAHSGLHSLDPLQQ